MTVTGRLARRSFFRSFTQDFPGTLKLLFNFVSIFIGYLGWIVAGLVLLMEWFGPGLFWGPILTVIWFVCFLNCLPNKAQRKTG
jgi:hypothetical protein